MSHTILLVDDDTAILDVLGRYLDRLDHEVMKATDGREAVVVFETHRPDVVVLDLVLPDVTDLELLETLTDRGATVILLTGHGDVETAVRAMQMGAENFLTKPVDLPHFGAAVARAWENARIRRENERLRREGSDSSGLEGLGVSPHMRELARKVRVLAASDRTTVLLTGESGTGKGWVARMLHDLSPRAQRPFVELNSAGLTPTFLASELFGHEKGAFTDAVSRRDGLFLEADRGTLFLDEVGELNLELQPRLLNVLETRTFRRLGGTRDLSSDVRFVAATNRDLAARVAGGSFREDLYYRLNVAPLHLPPLRERSPDDRLALLHGLLSQLGKEIPGSPGSFAEPALRALLDYAWPGNIREMRNVLERALIFADGVSELQLSHLPDEVRTRNGGSRWKGFRPESLESVERRHIEKMVRHHQGNRTHAAKELGIARTTLIHKIERYELDV